MMQRPWAPGTIDEWLPRSLRLCWGGDGGGGFGGDSGGGWSGDSGGGATTGGGDWGSSGSYDASGYNAGGDLGAWAGSAYDASTAGTGMGGGGDWGSFGDTSYGSFNAPNPIFTDVAGPNPGVTTGGGDWGSAGMFSAAGTGGGPGGAMFGADLGAGAGAPGQVSSSLWGDYPSGGGNLFGDQGGGLFGGGGSTYGGGGGGYTGGGGGKGGGGGSFGGFGSAGTSSGGRSGGPLGASNVVAAAPTASRGETLADTVGGGSLAGPGGKTSSDAPTRSEAEVESAGDPDAAPSDFGTPAETSETSEAAPAESTAAPSQSRADTSPSLTDAAPAGWIGGQPDTAAPATSQSAFGPQSLNTDYQGSPYASDYDQGAAPSQPAASFDSRFGAFQSFEAQPGWNPAEQTAGVTGLAEPTAWAANPYQPSTDVSVGRDFNQAFESFDTPTGMDLAGDLRSETEPSVTFNEMWGETPYSTLPSDQISRSAQETLESDFSFFPNPGYVQGPPAPTLHDRLGTVFNPVLDTILSPVARGIDYLMGLPNPTIGTPDPATAWSNVAQSTLLGGSNIQSLNPDAFTAFEAGQQGRAGANPDTTPWGSVFEGAAPTQAQPSIEATIPGGRETNFEYGAPPAPPAPPTTIDVEVVRSDDPALITGGQLENVTHPPAGGLPVDAPPAPPGTLPPAVETPESRPAEQPQEAPPQAPQEAPPQQPQQPQQPQEAPPQAPPLTSQVPPSLIEQAQTAPPMQSQPAVPGLVTMLPPGAQAPPVQPAEAPQQQPPPQPGQPGEPDYDEEGEGEPSVPAQPGGRLGAPTTRTQNTPVTTARVRQEQQGATRSRPVNEALHGILTRAADHAGVIVRVGSGGQIATRARTDYKQPGGWTGSTRHNHGNAADLRLEQNGRLLNYNNPQDRVVMEAFVREAARLGATGMGAGMRYMGPNTIHVGFGGTNFWKADNPGSLALRQAWREGLQGPANRPPADIPARPAQQASVPLPRARPTDVPQPDVAQPRPPADIPPAAGLPPEPPAPSPVAPRPLADIPARGPNEFDIPVTPPVRNATVIANNILKQATAHLNKDSGQAAFQAASVVAAKALAAAGIPANLARSLMTKGALDGAIANGYGPGGPNSTVMGFSIWGKVQSSIAEGVDAAMQGYQPAKPGELRGPPAPAQQRSQAPSGGLFHFAAGPKDAYEEQADLPLAPDAELQPGMPEWGTAPRSPDLFGPPETLMPPPPPALRDPNELGAEPGFTISRPSTERQASLLDYLQGNSIRALAKGGRVAGDEPVVVGEEGPEYFVPDRPGTVVPHMPQPQVQPGRNIDRWPKLPAVNYPGQYGGVEREMMRQTRSAQDPVPSLMDMIDREQLRLNAANWHRMINDPSLIALGRSRIEDRR